MNSPTLVKAFLHSSVALYDVGCNAGMTDARDTKYTKGQDKSHVYKLMELLVRRDDLGMSNESDINIQYARGYLSGYTAIISGVMA